MAMSGQVCGRVKGSLSRDGVVEQQTERAFNAYLAGDLAQTANLLQTALETARKARTCSLMGGRRNRG